MSRDFKQEKQYKRNQILRKLGTFGWEPISLFLFASCLTGSPIIVYGSHGAGKTMTFRRIATKCFGTQYALYDASKTNLVDIVGYPDVSKYQEGIMSFVSTPMSIWGKEVLILDEATRSRDDTQNNYLELLRNGTMQGIDTGVRHKFLAANDMGYQGTRPLDEAFASRIAFTCQVPIFLRMDEEDQKLVARSQEGVDSIGLRVWDPERENPDDLIPDMTEEFHNFMKELTAYYSQVENTYRQMFTEYVIKFATLLRSATMSAKKSEEGKKKVSNALELDARTCVTLISNLLACVTLEMWEYENLKKEFSNEKLRETALDTIQHSFPWALSGVEVDPAVLLQAHEVSYSILETQDMVNYTISTEENPIRKVMLSLIMEEEEPVAIYDSIEELLEDEDSLNATIFVLSIADYSRKVILDKLEKKPEYKKRLFERRVDILRSAVNVDLKKGDPYGEILAEQFGVDLDAEVPDDVRLKYTLLYLTSKYKKELFSMDLVQYQIEVKQCYEVTNSIIDLIDSDYETVRKRLLAARK